jgi:hypothetical protein
VVRLADYETSSLLAEIFLSIIIVISQLAALSSAPNDIQPLQITNLKSSPAPYGPVGGRIEATRTVRIPRRPCRRRIRYLGDSIRYCRIVSKKLIHCRIFLNVKIGHRRVYMVYCLIFRSLLPWYRWWQFYYPNLSYLQKLQRAIAESRAQAHDYRPPITSTKRKYTRHPKVSTTSARHDLACFPTHPI